MAVVSANAGVSGAASSTGGAAARPAVDGHKSDVTSLACFDDGRGVVTASEDKTLRMWDVVEGGAPLLVLEHEESVNGSSQRIAAS